MLLLNAVLKSCWELGRRVLKCDLLLCSWSFQP